MITGINISATKDYISKFDKGEQKTTWKIGALDSDIFDLIGEYSQNPLKMTSEVVRFGLKGFENFKDAKENIINFDTISRSVGRSNYNVVADSIMKILPPEIKSELSAEILKLSKLSEEEIKN